MSLPKLGSKTGFVALALTGVLATGCSAVVGGGVLVGIATIGALAYSCDEPVGIDVWDRRTAHKICDATIVAELEENGKPAGHPTAFSPCYRAYLGTGTWQIKATKPGYTPALGSVVIDKKRRCSEPTFHSLELTLVPEGYGAAPAYTSAPVPTSAPVEAEPPPLQSAAPPPPATALPPVPQAAPLAPATPPAAPAPSAAPATPAPPAN